MAIENNGFNAENEDDDLQFGRTYTQADWQRMDELCEAAHDQEHEFLKAKLDKLAASEENRYDLFRYHRYNTHIEVILHDEDDYGDDALIAVSFDEDQWTHLDGHCARETFEHLLEAVSELWEHIKDYVLANEMDFGSVKIGE